jgi:hypothetical protein
VGVKEILEAILKGLYKKSKVLSFMPCKNIPVLHLNLLEKLFDKGYGFEEAAKFVSRNFLSLTDVPPRVGNLLKKYKKYPGFFSRVLHFFS